MGDVRCSLVTATIPTSTASATAAVSIANTANAFLIGAGNPSQTAGFGPTSGVNNGSHGNKSTTAVITDASTVTFDDGNTGTFQNNLCAAWLWEYIGAGGGDNEFVVRGTVQVSVANTASTADSSAIAGIVSLSKCVPFVTMRCNNDSSSTTNHYGDVQLVDTGGGNIVARVTRQGTSGTLIAEVSVVEFTGANWTVQVATHTFAASGTDEDETVSSVGAVANAFTWSTMRYTQTNIPNRQLYYVWLHNATTLRHRVHTQAVTPQFVRTWVISNPDLVVTRVGTPDGSNDLTGNTVATPQEIQTVALGTSVDLDEACLLTYAGSNDSTASTNINSMYRLWDFSDASTARTTRCNGVGDSEYVLQVIDLSGLESLVTVPDVVGETQASGTTELENAGFLVAVSGEYSNAVAPGVIISQSPTGGSEESEGSTVTIVVSLGDRGGGGKSKRRRYIVQVDGKDFEVNSVAEAHELLDHAKQLAQKAAEAQAERIEKVQRARSVGKVEPVEIKAPVIKTDAPVAVEAIQSEIDQIYARVSQALELRLLLARELEMDDEEVIQLLAW